jgi:AP-1 complex subunit sigma 1/2
VVYRRYASLYFICGIDYDDNELITLEIIHRFVEVLDKHFVNVCELDIVLYCHFNPATLLKCIQSWVLLTDDQDEVIIAGHLQDSSKKNVTTAIDRIKEAEELDNLAKQMQ